MKIYVNERYEPLCPWCGGPLSVTVSKIATTKVFVNLDGPEPEIDCGELEEVWKLAEPRMLLYECPNPEDWAGDEKCGFLIPAEAVEFVREPAEEDPLFDDDQLPF